MRYRAQELCESRGGRSGLPFLKFLMVSVDVKQHERKKNLEEEGSSAQQSSGAV